jgi:hypothetical protein
LNEDGASALAIGRRDLTRTLILEDADPLRDRPVAPPCGDSASPVTFCWHPTLRSPFSRRKRIQITKKDTPKMSGQFRQALQPSPSSPHMPTHQTLITISFSVDAISRFTFSTSWSSRRSSCPDVMGILLRQIASEFRDEDRRKMMISTDVAGSAPTIAFWRIGSSDFWASLNVILQKKLIECGGERNKEK